MDWGTLDDKTLGQAVDAWLTALRAGGDLSERRLAELAGLLGEAMSEVGPRSADAGRVLRRFEAWQRTAFSRPSPA